MVRKGSRNEVISKKKKMSSNKILKQKSFDYNNYNKIEGGRVDVSRPVDVDYMTDIIQYY